MSARVTLRAVLFDVDFTLARPGPELGPEGYARAAGLRIGLVSNSARDVHDFARHHGLDVDAGISSFHHGWTKPHASIFRAVLDLLAVEPAEAVMVGDTIADDVEGALALGMRAILLDREGLHPDFEPRAEALSELPPLLELAG